MMSPSRGISVEEPIWKPNWTASITNKRSAVMTLRPRSKLGPAQLFFGFVDCRQVKISIGRRRKRKRRWMKGRPRWWRQGVRAGPLGCSQNMLGSHRGEGPHKADIASDRFCTILTCWVSELSQKNVFMFCACFVALFSLHQRARFLFLWHAVTNQS